MTRRHGFALGVLPVACALVFAVTMALPSIDVTFGTRTGHFVIVSGVSAVSLVLAIAVLLASRRLPDPRTFFLALGFLSLSTIFLAHGLGTSPLFAQSGGHAHVVPLAVAEPTDGYMSGEATPSASFQAPAQGSAGIPDSEQIARVKVVGYSALMSLLVSSVFFALATVSWGETLSARIVRWRAVMTVMIIATMATHVAIALWYPKTLAWIPMNQEPINWSLGATTTVLMGIAGWRFLQAYRIGLLPIQGAMAAGMVLLIESQWMMLFGRLWQTSWWMYHVAMLAGFALGAGALLVQYRQTGDLSAIVEGLFLRQQVKSMREGDPRAVRALTAAVAARDSETAEHIARVGELSVAMGKRLWLPSDRLEVLQWAGRLHDLGKIGVPGTILRKPGPLTPEEYDVMKLHTVRGWEIARRSGLLAEAAPIIRAHHERLDGSGYPDGLRGDEISIEARIVAVADVWDALTCDRPYRKAMTAQEAAEILLAETGHHLDPGCVEMLLRVAGVQNYLRQVDAAARRAA